MCSTPCSPPSPHAQRYVLTTIARRAKALQEMLDKRAWRNVVLVDGEPSGGNLRLAARHIPNCRVLSIAGKVAPLCCPAVLALWTYSQSAPRATGVNVYTLLKHELLVLSTNAVRVLEERLSKV